MSAIFLQQGHQTFSSRRRFGLYDEPHPAKQPAYIDETNGGIWIAVVVNEDNHKPKFDVTFTAIDHSILMKRPDGKDAKRCDGVLTFESAIIFVELKQQDVSGNEWVKEAERQLRSTIDYFENNGHGAGYTQKKAYIANSERPRFKQSQAQRMERFLDETGYVLRIENRIVL
jgi:hypothetical protein